MRGNNYKPSQLANTHEAIENGENIHNSDTASQLDWNIDIQPKPPTFTTSSPANAAATMTASPSTIATPIWAWFLLIASLLSVSSAGVAFAMMQGVPPITLAAWRLQFTSLLLVTAAFFQWRGMDSDLKQKSLDHKSWLAGSGTALAVHFACWVASVQLTSLTHSLLFVSATPVLLAVLTLIRKQPISAGEIGGTALGFLGTLVLASSAASEEEVTVVGDLLALSASAAVIPYLLIGRKLRAFMPLFIYAAPVTLLAALQLTLASLLVEGSKIFSAGSGGVFGWVASTHFFPFVLYLGIVPGIVGHTGINALLIYMHPLIITLVLNVEPPVGAIMGYFLGVASAPGWLTYAGGVLILISTCAVSYASSVREKKDRGKVVAAAEVEAVFVGRLDDDDEEEEEEHGLLSRNTNRNTT
jgi:drug/metabolite transporter (DMT)-like permease